MFASQDKAERDCANASDRGMKIIAGLDFTAARKRSLAISYASPKDSKRLGELAL
jgi:hypothetical protein